MSTGARDAKMFRQLSASTLARYLTGPRQTFTCLRPTKFKEKIGKLPKLTLSQDQMLFGRSCFALFERKRKFTKHANKKMSFSLKTESAAFVCVYFWRVKFKIPKKKKLKFSLSFSKIISSLVFGFHVRPAAVVGG